MTQPSAEKPIPADVETFAKEEREYLHDLANPLAIASGMLEALEDDLSRAGVQLTEAQARKMEKTKSALGRIGDLVRARRARMIEIQEALPTKK